MDTRSPTSLGDRIRAARESARLSQQAVADHFGLTAQAVSQWETGATKPSTGRIAALARLLGAKLEWLINGWGPRTASRGLAEGGGAATGSVPVIDYVTAGSWSEIADPFMPGGGFDYIGTDLSISRNAFALIIDGLSMAPEFQPGDKIIIDPLVSPRPGEFVVAKLDETDEATFKKYRPRGRDSNGVDIIELVPLNPDWPPLSIDADHPGHIVGTMVEHRRYRH